MSYSRPDAMKVWVNQMLSFGRCSLLLPLAGPDGLQNHAGTPYTATEAGGITIGGSSSGPAGLQEYGSTLFDGSDDRITTDYGTRRNLVPNPRFLNGTTNWSQFTSTLTVVDTDLPTALGGGTGKVGRVTPSGSGGGIKCLDTSNSPTQILATSEVDHVCGLWIRSDGGSYPISVQFVPSDATTNLGTFTWATPTITSEWQWVSAAHAPEATMENLNINIRASGTYGGTYFEVVGVMVCPGEDTARPEAGGFFDGSGYIDDNGTWIDDPGGHVGWLGTAHASASDKGFLAAGTTRTMAVWAKQDDAGDNVLIADAQGNYNIPIRPAASGTVHTFRNGGSFVLISAAYITLTDWNLIVGTFTFDGTNLGYAAYVNGERKSSGSVVGGWKAPTGSALQVGAYAAGSQPWDGNMAGVAVWERGLSAEQVREAYEVGLYGFELPDIANHRHKVLST